MSFFTEIYKGMINFIVEEKKPEKSETPHQDSFVCNLCEKTCSMICECKCHVPYCDNCEKSHCDYKKCICKCHIDEIQTTPNVFTYENLPNLQSEASVTIPQQNTPQRETNSKLNNGNAPQVTPQSMSSFHPLSTTETKQSEPPSFANNEFSKAIEKVQINESSPKRANTNRESTSNELSINKSKLLKKASMKKLSEEDKKALNLDTEPMRTEENEKKEVTIRRYSKYSKALMEQSESDNNIDIIDIMKGRKSEIQSKRIINFRSKSKEKKSKRAKLEKDESINPEQVKKIKEIPLNMKLKAQFDRFKLTDLKVPDKLGSYVDEKFIRDKSEVTKYMEKLTRDLKQDNYSDKNKLAKNIFNDFENQESWQSYTTLLFADLSKDVEENANKDKDKNKKTEVAKVASIKN